MPVSNEPRVLIAMPTLGINPDPDKWLNSFIKITNNCRREGFAHALFAPYRQTWWPANNQIWDAAFANKFDYILRLDDDICDVPADAFSSLLWANKIVIGAAYCNRRFPFNVQALINNKKLNLVETYKQGAMVLDPVVGYDSPDTDIKKVDLVGFGMTLIKVDPFKWMERPMYKGDEVCPDDTYFAQLCIENGIEQFVHMGVRLKHDFVTLKNAGHLFNAGVIEIAEKQAEAMALLKTGDANATN